MPDMLVKLYDLPPMGAELERLAAHGINIRRALAPEKHLVCAWVLAQFEPHWQSECEVAFAHQPIGCFVAIRDQTLVGFGCYNVTAKGFFGPEGVAESARGLGVGKGLLLACLHSLWHEGYAYAIIGDAGPVDFYQKTVGAVLIENSIPGIYRGMLQA